MRLLKCGFAVAIFASAGCGPSFTEARMGYAPPLPENCDVKVVNLPMADVAMAMGPSPAGNSDYDFVGTIGVSGVGDADPFNPELLSELRPRICKMGGTEVSLGMSASVPGAFGSNGTVTYMVLKKKAGAESSSPSESGAAASSASPTQE